MSEPLYTPAILRLTIKATEYPRLPNADASETLRTPVCGSVIDLDITLDDAGAIAATGFDIRACAMGQASSALFAASVVGRTPAELTAMVTALEAWLQGATDDAPDWPGIAILAPARSRPGRHAAILLPFRAGAAASTRAAAGHRAGAAS